MNQSRSAEPSGYEAHTKTNRHRQGTKTKQEHFSSPSTTALPISVAHRPSCQPCPTRPRRPASGGAAIRIARFYDFRDQPCPRPRPHRPRLYRADSGAGGRAGFGCRGARLARLGPDRLGQGRSAYGLAFAPTLLGGEERFDRPGSPKALVIAPTRELAMQVHRELSWLYAQTGARILSCIGGMDGQREGRALEAGCHIVVGTPGPPLRPLGPRPAKAWRSRGRGARRKPTRCSISAFATSWTRC